jgi:hypothetical protein
MPSPGGVECGGVLRLIVDPVKAERWRPCGARLGYVGGEPKVPQDSLDHGRLFNQRDQPQPPTAAWTRPDIDAERPAHQLRPTGTQPGTVPRNGRPR